MKLEKLVNSKLITFLLSFFMTWAVMKVCSLDTGSIFTLLFFGLSFLLINYVRKSALDHIKRFKRESLVIAVLFSATMEIVSFDFFTSGFENPLFIGIIAIATFLGIAILTYYSVMSVYLWIDGRSAVKEGEYKHLLLIFILSFIFCFICYLPHFLFQFPGILTPDSLVQMEQVWGIAPYSNHHPWMHTMVIKLWYDLGYKITGNVYIGIAFYTVFQMVMMSATAAYSVRTLALFRVKKSILMLVLLFYGLIPYNGVFATTMWKDVLFSVAVLSFICSLTVIYTKKARYILVDYIILFLSAFWICVGRSNGWYGMLLALPFLCIYLSKKKALRGVAVVLGAVLVAVIVKWPVMNAVGVTQPDFVESLCIPLQQISNVLCHDRELSSEQRELVESVIDTTYIKELYDPTFADNMKELVRAGHPEYLENHKAEYLKLYVELGLKYPKDYLEAYVNQTEGFYSPRSFGTVANVMGISPNPYNLVTQPIIGGAIVTKINEILIKINDVIPIYGLTGCIGTIFWLTVMAFGYEISCERSMWINYIPVFALIITVLIATPVVCDIRYVYYMVLSAPVLMVLSKREEND